MKPVNGKILVRVDQHQKDEFEVGGVKISTANNYDTNRRYTSPTIAEVVEGKEELRKGDTILIHHNLCSLPSPYHLYGDLFSIPYSRVLFAKIYSSGEIKPICGNILCETIDIETDYFLPPDMRKKYIDRSIVLDPGNTPYKQGQVIFHRPYAAYEICFTQGSIAKRIHKVSDDQICGCLISEK